MTMERAGTVIDFTYHFKHFTEDSNQLVNSYTTLL